jgi:glycosyltransferase involved in cell wall biosynthesis
MRMTPNANAAIATARDESPVRLATAALRAQPQDPHAARPKSRRPLHVAMVHLSDYRFDSRVQRQARALAERGDIVDLVCLGDRDEHRVGEGMIRVHPVPGTKPSGGTYGYLRGYTRFLAAAMRKLTVLELRHRFDVVQVHNMPDALTFAAVVPRLRGAPVILDVHDTFPELFASKFDRRYDSWAVRLLELEERFSAAIANRLVTVTDEARVRLAERGIGAGRTDIVMNSPDQAAFGPPRVPITLPADGEIRVIYHGGIARRFGVETLIRAFEQLTETAPRVTLRVCGPGEELEALRALAARIAPDKIELLGPLPFKTIPDELQAAHIGAVTTLHDRFTELLLPVKLLEYAHMGLPIVASDLPGITRYFSDRELRLFEPGSPESLAAAIEEVCLNPFAARERAKLAAERLSTIAWEQQRDNYLRMVDRLVTPVIPLPVGSPPAEMSEAA